MTRFRLYGLALALVIAGLLALAVAYGRVIGRVNSNQRANTHALCTLRADLQTRASEGERFLASHPHGIPGVPAPTLRSSLSNEQATIRALAPLTCPPN